MLRNLGRTRVAVLTGWAVDPNCRFRYHAHAAFPLSDHADYSDLVEFVKAVSPKKVYTLHGFAAEFAHDLRQLGYDAQPLSEEDQLSLPLAIPPGTLRVPGRAVAPPSEKSPAEKHPILPESEAFQTFAARCAQIAATTRKLEKIRLLADYFRLLSSPSLNHAAVWFTGHAFPPSQNKKLQLGWALIRDALCAVGNLDQAGFGQVYLKHSDLGEAALEILEQVSPDSAIDPSAPFTMEAVSLFFDQVLAARGPSGKLPILVQALRRCQPLEAKFLVKILTGDLRIGLKEGLVEESIAQAFEAPLDQVKNANLLVGNIGETAVLAQHQQLPAVTLIPFRPVKYMLASPEQTAADIWRRVEEWHATPSPATPGTARMAWSVRSATSFSRPASGP